MFVPKNAEWSRLEQSSRARLLEDAVREVARRSFSGAFVYFGTVFALLFASSVWRDHPVSTGLTLAFTFIGAGVRCIAARRLLKESMSRPEWGAALRISTLATVAAWGIYCAATVYIYGNDWPAAFLIIVGAALGGGAASSLAPDVALGLCSILLIVFPTGLCALLRGVASSTLLGIAAWFYTAYLCVQALNNWRTYWKIATASAFDAMLSRRAATESEIRFRTLFEDAPSGMYVARADGCIEMANFALAHMLRYDSPDEIAGRSLRDFAAEGDRADIGLLLAASGYAAGCESDWTRRDGMRIRVRESARAVHGAPDAEGRLLGSVEDVTARFASDETRRELIEILEGTSDFVESVSATGETRYLNRAARLLSGGPNTSLWARAGDEHLRKARLSRAERDGIWEGEAWLLAAGGKAVPVSQVIIPHRGRDGSVHSFSIISRDISAIRAAEQALRETQEQLFQSQRLESLGRLAGGIAHDFNNLLTIVMGHASMLMHEIRRGQPFDSLVEIRKAAERAADLTRQLLAFGRRQVLSIGIIDVNEIVRAAERMLRRVIGERVELITRLSGGELAVSADAAQLEQMLVNLVLNARDAMPDGGTAVIETSIAGIDEPGAGNCEECEQACADRREYVRITVSDTGIGMDEETQARIFEPFFSTKVRGHGAGLGLATAYGFVNQSGGRISVSSIPGAGTSFEVLLPRCAKTVALGVREEPQQILRGTERILIVDDEPALLGLLRQTLAGYGYRVLAAANGEEALSMASRAEGPPDLLVTDVIMPGLTGPQLAVRLRAILPDIGILFISGYPGETEADREAFGPGSSYLAKPFTAEGLLRVIRQQLQRKRSGTAKAAGHAG